MRQNKLTKAFATAKHAHNDLPESGIHLGTASEKSVNLGRKTAELPETAANSKIRNGSKDLKLV